MFDVFWFLVGIIVGFLACAILTADKNDKHRGRPA